MADEEIFFFANYKGWQAVKKKAIDENTEEKEIVQKSLEIIKPKLEKTQKLKENMEKEIENLQLEQKQFQEKRS